MKTRSVSLGTRLLLASIVFVVLVVAVFAPLVIAVLNLRESTDREASAQNRSVAARSGAMPLTCVQIRTRDRREGPTAEAPVALSAR